MQETMQILAALCMGSALCSLLLQDSHYRHTVRMILGLEIFRVVLVLLSGRTPSNL